MTKDDIIFLPNKHLRQKSAKVGLITPEILQIVQDMKDATISWDQSREHEVGVALAAVQIDRLYRIVVVRNDYNNKADHRFTTFINPEIVKAEGELLEDYEGCLSVPNLYGKVKRHSKVKVKALDQNGREFRVTAEGFLARIFQHEIDHTNGLLFIDHIKDDPDAFYRMGDDGKLSPLPYDQVDQSYWED
ncbi:peptide deformylase [Candidatus Saccharibacteria bacterium]|jgi:peptide deformylase|nr:peptide deformylase [Candidatus Saccharibacteria bacterium]HPG37244.1 peptide deformylase [Candidatus Saccharibacteria bacterium]